MVTGASSGIGLAFAERLAVDGYDLVISARRRDRLEELAERLRREQNVGVKVIEADLGSRFDIAKLAETAAAEPLACLVNNAGLAHYMPFKDLPTESAEELVSVNVLAPTLLAHAAWPGMIKRGAGAVINVASMLAFSGTAVQERLPGRAVYAATKAYVVAFSQVLQTELRGTGVDVQALCPGVVRSEFHTRQGLDLSSRPRLDPDQVVTASMIALGSGELVCSPTLEDPTLIEQVGEAQRALLDASFRPEPAERYRQD
jgi:short-subunit dehydrogenase